MRLLHLFRSRDRNQTAQATTAKSFGVAGIDWLRADEPAAVFANAYQQVVWVYRAINVLAEQVANIPFLFSTGERGRESLLTGGPLLDFYHRPHPQLDRFQYWELRIIWLMLRGECFRVPIFEPGTAAQPRRLSRLLILDPAHFQHIVQDHRLAGWRYTGLGNGAPLESQIFLPEEIWFEKLPNPFDFWRGLPPLYAAATAARTDFAAANFMRGIIENNADAGVIVRTEQPLDPEQQEQLFAALRERKRKAGTPDRPVLLSGCSEVIKPQLSSTDLQFLENRKFSRAEICAAFGVPEEIVTSTDSAKYDVMRGARLNFIENRVAPLCGRLEACEQLTVRALDPHAVGWFDLDSLPILQEARRERLVAARTGFDMGIPFNELNRVLDLGFKALPWGNAGHISTRYQRLGETAPPIKQASSPEDSERTVAWPDRLQQLLADASCRHRESENGVFEDRQKKLRRYVFEQRRRVLARWEECRRASAASAIPLLALEQENEQLLNLVMPWSRADFCSGMKADSRGAAPLDIPIPPSAIDDLLAAQKALVRNLNQTTAQALDALLNVPQSSNDPASAIRSIYNKLAARSVDSLLRDLSQAAWSAGRAAASVLLPRSTPTLHPENQPTL